jgi:hypothetical protein
MMKNSLKYFNIFFMNFLFFIFFFQIFNIYFNIFKPKFIFYFEVLIKNLQINILLIFIP